ncbi:MAG TPA: GNAT family N-acetyltransferase [Aggregatilineales bacterium]|nr:GNAT family N-acetyltransferase [Aggregatilineales bacterium]
MDFIVRRAVPEDYQAVHRIFTGPKVIWGTAQLPFPSPELWHKRLTDPAEGIVFLVACASEEVVGHLGLHTNPTWSRRRHSAGIGMAVRDDWQGKGVGTALMQAAVDLADKWLNLCRLELQVYVDNEPATRLYKHFDFAIEGTLRAYVFRDGQYVDAYSMARVRNPTGI